MEKPRHYFKLWQESEKAATEAVTLCNRLRVESGVLVHVCDRSIAKVSAPDVLKAHRHAHLVLGRDLVIQETLPILREISRRTKEMRPCRIDIGRLTDEFRKELESRKGKAPSISHAATEFVRRKLAPAFGDRRPVLAKARDIVLYGFGRIGRLFARELAEKTGQGDKLMLRAAVVRPPSTGVDDLAKRAALVRLDSVHGHFRGTTMLDREDNALVLNGSMMRVIHADGPEKADYSAFGIEDAIVVDNTGKWRDRVGLERHLAAKGVAKVLLTAPGKGDIPNIVFGVNHESLDPAERIVSAASCTTNAIVPVLKVVNDRFGVEHGHMETVHAYTNDQNLIDNFHKKARRGRAAALNMVITETGAASAVAKALPELKGRITGSSIRVPTPNVSLAVLNLQFGTATNKDELNELLRQTALASRLRNQIDFTTSEDIVSSDLVGSRHAGIVDGAATIVADDGRNAVLYVWYDNEYGYTCQAMRLLQHMAGINGETLPDLP